MRQLIFYPKSQQGLILPKDTDEWDNIRRIFSSFYFPYLKRCLDLNPHSNTNLAKAATLKLQNGIKWENGLNSNNLTENVLHIRRIKYRKKMKLSVMQTKMQKQLTEVFYKKRCSQKILEVADLDCTTIDLLGCPLNFYMMWWSL